MWIILFTFRAVAQPRTHTHNSHAQHMQLHAQQHQQPQRQDQGPREKKKEGKQLEQQQKQGTGIPRRGARALPADETAPAEQRCDSMRYVFGMGH